MGRDHQQPHLLADDLAEQRHEAIVVANPRRTLRVP